MNEKDLRQLIEEQYRKLTLEQGSEEVPTGDEPDAASPTSVDAQIDELLLQYEKLSIPNAGDDLLEALKNSSLRFILEQEEVNVDVNVEEEGEGEGEAEEEAEEAEAEADVEAEKKLPELDIATFALKVARLAEIPEKVLDLKDAIINRAIQYLETNYDDNVAKEFETALMDKFQLAVPEEEVDSFIEERFPGLLTISKSL